MGVLTGVAALIQAGVRRSAVCFVLRPWEVVSQVAAAARGREPFLIGLQLASELLYGQKCGLCTAVLGKGLFVF